MDFLFIFVLYCDCETDHTDVEEESEEGSVDDGSIGTWKVEICISNAPASGYFLVYGS